MDWCGVASTIRACLTTTTGSLRCSAPRVGASRSSGRSSSLLLRSLGVVAPAARAADDSVAVIVVPPFAPSAYADRGAVGLLVPGAGSTVSRERALASLVRGRVVSSLVDLDGTPEIQLADSPGHDHHLRLPAAAGVASQRHALSRRDRRAGLPRPAHLGSTRIDGLVSLADIAPTAKAIAAGETPPIRSRASSDAAAALARLDVELTRAHDARTGATLVLVGWLVAFAALGILARRRWRAVPPCSSRPSRSGRRCSSARVGVDEPSTVIATLAVVDRRRLVPARAPTCRARARGRRFLVAFLVVLAAWPEINALAAIGPHPDGGGRFYGITNEVETLLLAPSLAAAAAAGVIGATAIGLLLLVLVGWSRAGADGGGLLVVTAAFAVLLAGLTRVRLTPARIALGIVGVLAIGLAIVGIDALLGGSSHVTDAVGGGPGTLFDDLDRRLRISWAGATSAAHTAFLCLLSLGGLAWLGIRGRRAAGDRRHARRDRRVAARQRHARRRARLRRARLPGAHGLGGDALAQPLSERTEASSRLPEPQEHPAR